MSKRIFISYGTADAREIAEWLFQGLRDLGYEPWWDKAQLPQQAGRAWDEQIEKAIRSSDVVLALMSPHSVRPQGECRNEINFACDQSKPVVPVMVRKCDRPLRLNSLQYIDLEGFESLSEEARKQRLKLLCAAIEDGPKDDPACHELYTQFQRFDFDWIYTRHRNLTGRTWLMDKFDAWLRHDAEPVLVLVGGPGVGKSAVLAEWVKTRMHVGAVHYCRHDRHDLRSPEAMVASLSGQLLRHEIPGHREALQAFLKDPHAQRDAGSMLHRLVLDPLRKQSGDRPWVLAIDALDEGGESIYELLASVRPYLDPRRIRLLLTSRPEAEVLQLFDHKLVLSAEGLENQADLQAYVRGRLAQSSIGANLTSGRCQAIEREILNRCEGNFLIAQVTLDELDAGRMTPEQVENLPSGLGALYAGYFQRRFATKESFAPVREVLEVVMGAFEPVPDEFIAKVLGVGTRRVAESLQALGSLLPKQGPQGARVPFHKSLLDWLESLEPGTKFACSRETGMERLAQALESVEFDGAYSLRWRIKHLHTAGRLVSAQNWLLNLNYLQLRVDAGLGRAVLEDLDLLPANESLVELRALCRQRMALWISKDTAVMEDAINHTVYGGNLHRLAEAQTPRPYLELASDRPALALTDRVLPHKGMEFAIPLSPKAGAKERELRIVTFSADRFLVWNDIGEELHQGSLHTVKLPRPQGARDLLEKVLDIAGLDSQEFGFLGGFCTRYGDLDHARWFHGYKDDNLHVVRLSRERIDFVTLSVMGGSVVVAPEQEIAAVLRAIGFEAFMTGDSGAPYFLRLSPDSHFNQSAYVVCRSDRREPMVLLPAGDCELHGRKIPVSKTSLWRDIQDCSDVEFDDANILTSSLGHMLIFKLADSWWLVDMEGRRMTNFSLVEGVSALVWSRADEYILQLGQGGVVRIINSNALHDLDWRSLTEAQFKVVGVAADRWRPLFPDLIEGDEVSSLWRSKSELLNDIVSMPSGLGDRFASVDVIAELYGIPTVMAEVFCRSWFEDHFNSMFAWKEVKSIARTALAHWFGFHAEAIETERNSYSRSTQCREVAREVEALVYQYHLEKLSMLQSWIERARQLEDTIGHQRDPGLEVRLHLLRESRSLYRLSDVPDSITWGGRLARAFRYLSVTEEHSPNRPDGAPSIQRAIEISQILVAAGELVHSTDPQAPSGFNTMRNSERRTLAFESLGPAVSQVWGLKSLPLLGSATQVKSTFKSIGASVRYVRLRWKSASELQALKEPGARVSIFNVLAEPEKREQLVSQGSMKHDPVKSGKFPPLGKAVEWDESGVRIRAGVFEIQRNGANPGRLMMGVAIKGYLQNPFDRDLIAAIDVQGRVLVMRVHR